MRHDITIKQDAEGRYCLNDLHRASGNARKDEPTNWRNVQSFKDMKAELSTTGTPVVVINGGPNRGTYVCEEMVYAYAMWVSAAFSLQVIRTFRDVVTGQLQPTQSAIPDNRGLALMVIEEADRAEAQEKLALQREQLAIVLIVIADLYKTR